jgi:hypothetical protein
MAYEQSDLYTYHGSDYYKNSQDVLTVLESGFYPYVPFTKGMELRLHNQIIQAQPGGLTQQSYEMQLANYEASVEDPVNKKLDQTIATSMGLKGDMRKAGVEIGNRLSNVVTNKQTSFAQGIPPRLTNRPINIPGEIAVDVVAQNIFDKMAARDKNFGREFELGAKLPEDALQQGFDYDPEKAGDEFAVILETLKNKGVAKTNKVVGVETTIARGGKYFQQIMNQGYKGAESMSQEMWKKGVKDVDAFTKRLTGKYGNTNDLKKIRDSIKSDDKSSKHMGESLNLIERQVLDRLIGITSVIGQNPEKDRYLYHMPLKGDDGLWTKAGILVIGIKKVGGKYEGFAKDGGMFDMGVFGTLDNLILMQAQVSGLISKAEANVIGNMAMAATSNEAISKFADDVAIGAISQKTVEMASEFDGAINVARVLSTKQLATAIIESFENYSDMVVKNPLFANVVKESLGKSNNLSQTWKERAYRALPRWRNGAGFTSMSFDDTGSNPEGAWAESMKPNWNKDTGKGVNLAISPYFLESKKRIAQKFGEGRLTKSGRRLPESSGIKG